MNPDSSGTFLSITLQAELQQTQYTSILDLCIIACILPRTVLQQTVIVFSKFHLFPVMWRQCRIGKSRLGNNE